MPRFARSFPLHLHHQRHAGTTGESAQGSAKFKQFAFACLAETAETKPIKVAGGLAPVSKA